MTTDLRQLWDFDDASGSEQRFRALAAGSAEPVATYASTQVARALGLQERYDEGHAVLDALSPGDPESRVRVALERGRLLRSAGDEAGARPHVEEAAAEAQAAGLDRARASTDPAARDWDASLLNNIGMLHADAGDHAAALAAFEEALGARVRIGDDPRTRVARWMVGWSLRLLGELDRAREVQLALKAELDAIGETDPYVDEELALLDPPGGV